MSPYATYNRRFGVITRAHLGDGLIQYEANSDGKRIFSLFSIEVKDQREK